MSFKGHCFEFDAININDYNVLLFIGYESKYFPPKMMQIINSINKRKHFRRISKIKKQLNDCELWADGEYIGTMNCGMNFDVIKNYFEDQGNKEENEYIRKWK